MRRPAALAACSTFAAALTVLAPAAPAGAVDEACPSGRVAMSFDDGPSAFRPQTLQILRDKRVVGTFLDIGMRVAANPHIARFQVQEGHNVLNHTYTHDNLGQLDAADVRRQILATEHVFDEARVRMPFAGVRAPFGGSSPTSLQVIEELGYLNVGVDAGGFDFIPTTPAATIRDAILDDLGPGEILLMHDGPIDTPAGEAALEALPQIIDGARAQGYCFGGVDSSGEVVPDRLTPSSQPIPQITNPVPFRPIAFAGVPPLSPPEPYAVVQGLPVRHLSVDVADQVAAEAMVRSLARDVEELVDAGETAQLRSDVDEQRSVLVDIGNLLRTARPSKIDAAARAALLAQVQRMLDSVA